MKVIRIIQYEVEHADEAILRRAISASMPDGIHNKGLLTISIATHYSELPPLKELAVDNEEIHAALRSLENAQTN